MGIAFTFPLFFSVVQNASIRMIKLLPLANIMQPIWSLKLVRDGVLREFAKLNHYSRYLVTTHISIRDPWKFQYKTRFFMIYWESMYIFQDHIILSWEHCRSEIVLWYVRTIAWLWYNRCPWSLNFQMLKQHLAKWKRWCLSSVAMVEVRGLRFM